MVGVVELYVGRIHNEVKQRPLYVIDHTVGLAVDDGFLDDRKVGPPRLCSPSDRASGQERHANI
jgi:hypothetical protein